MRCCCSTIKHEKYFKQFEFWNIFLHYQPNVVEGFILLIRRYCVIIYVGHFGLPIYVQFPYDP